jgi:hypothetical protein
MEDYSLEYLKTQTCRSFGGNNCVLHGCMFDCQLKEAKKRAIEKNGVKYTEKEIIKILECTKS